MYQYLSNMQKRRNHWKVKEMKMVVYLKLTWSIPLYTQQRKSSVIKQTVQSELMYAIKIVSIFFHLIFHFTLKICLLSLLNCFASIHFYVTYWEKTFNRPRKCVCQVRPFSKCHDGYLSAPAILQKPSQCPVVSRPLTINQVNSRRFIDWFSCWVQRYGVVVL